MNNKMKALLACLLVVATAPANAISVQVDYSFAVSNPSGFGAFPDNTAVLGQAVFDTESTPIFASPTQNIYALLSHTVQIDGVSYTPTTNSFDAFQTAILFQDQVPFTPPRDRIQLYSSFDIDMGGLLNLAYVGFVLEGLETIFSGPTAYVPDPSAFYSGLGFVTFTNGELCPACSISSPLNVTFTPITTPVPEPGTMVLFGLGIAALRLVRYRRAA